MPEQVIERPAHAGDILADARPPAALLERAARLTFEVDHERLGAGLPDQHLPEMVVAVHADQHGVGLDRGPAPERGHDLVASAEDHAQVGCDGRRQRFEARRGASKDGGRMFGHPARLGLCSGSGGAQRREGGQIGSSSERLMHVRRHAAERGDNVDDRTATGSREAACAHERPEMVPGAPAARGELVHGGQDDRSAEGRGVIEPAEQLRRPFPRGIAAQYLADFHFGLDALPTTAKEFDRELRLSARDEERRVRGIAAQWSDRRGARDERRLTGCMNAVPVNDALVRGERRFGEHRLREPGGEVRGQGRVCAAEQRHDVADGTAVGGTVHERERDRRARQSYGVVDRHIGCRILLAGKPADARQPCSDRGGGRHQASDTTASRSCGAIR